jgi:hypothetical protein
MDTLINRYDYPDTSLVAQGDARGKDRHTYAE